MARIVCLVVPGLPHDVTHRRETTFFEDADDRLYQDLLAEAVALNGAGSAASTLPAGVPEATPEGVPAVAALGAATWLMMSMPNFRHVFLSDLEWMVMPPILLNQYRLFRADGRIVAFAAWAYLSEAAEARLQEPNPRLAPADWKSGDRLWLVSMIAPYGHGELALKELEETALKGKGFKMHRRGKDGAGKVEIVIGGRLD